MTDVFNASIQYTCFSMEEDVARWNRDEAVQIRMSPSPSEHCLLEGMWSPAGCREPESYRKAIAGVCIWNKYDCLFKFKPLKRGYSGAIRSLSSPRDRQDMMKRAERGKGVVERVAVSSDPFGDYQIRTIGWQADTIARLGVEFVYYMLPLMEYKAYLSELEPLLPSYLMGELRLALESHHGMLKEYIASVIDAEVEFVYPMLQDSVRTENESYVWPYKNLDADLGIEEMQEVRIVYEAIRGGAAPPPVLLGMLGPVSPYLQRRKCGDDSVDILCGASGNP